MFGQRFTRGAVLAGLALVLAPLAARATEPTEATIRIGMVQTLLKDVPDTLVALMAQPFNTLMKTQTGMKGDMIRSGDALALGKDLAEQKVQLGIFLGYEFAWAKQKYPELEPLMIVINQHKELHAFIVIRADSELTKLSELKDQALALGKGIRPHCHLFLDKCCKDHCQCEPCNLCKLANTSSMEDALDDVVEGQAQATLVDSVAWESYQRRKPSRFAQLKIFEESGIFPAAVVAHKPGVLTADQIEKFKKGMATAHESVLGRQLLTLWKITNFEPVPENYSQTLKDIVVVYPPPVVVPVVDDAKAIEELLKEEPKPLKPSTDELKPANENPEPEADQEQ
jgi:ABC-type phosphate/phosphonate transport system substrate-binding protein